MPTVHLSIVDSAIDHGYVRRVALNQTGGDAGGTQGAGIVCRAAWLGDLLLPDFGQAGFAAPGLTRVRVASSKQLRFGRLRG